MYQIERNSDITGPVIPFSKDLFLRADLSGPSRLSEAAVADADGKILFALRDGQEYLEAAGGFPVVTYSHAAPADLFSQSSRIDETILDRFDTFLFDGMDEYLYRICAYIKRKHPEKQVVFLREEDGIFFEDVKTYKNDAEYGRKATIRSGHKQGNKRTSFSSIEFMAALLWAANETMCGEELPDRTVLLIEFDPGESGLGDIVKTAVGYTGLASDRGWIPVISLTAPSQYTREPGDNIWEYFFEQPGNMRPEDALRCRHVIRGSDNAFCLGIRSANPLFSMSVPRGFRLKLTRYAEERVSGYIPAHFSGAECTAVLYRGSDMAFVHQYERETDSMFSFIDRIRKEEEPEGQVFLATEDAEVFQAFREHYQDDLVFVEQIRIKADDVMRGRMVSEVFMEEYSDMREFGCRYLAVIRCLGRCRRLIYNVDCGALYLVRAFGGLDSGAEPVCVSDKNVPENDENVMFVGNTEQIVSCGTGLAEYLQEHPVSVLYGLGSNAQILYPFFEKFEKTLVFCDRRAKEPGFRFKGNPVIPPEKLAQLAPGTDVIILATAEAGLIRAELKKIAGKNIRLIDLFSLLIEQKGE